MSKLLPHGTISPEVFVGIYEPIFHSASLQLSVKSFPQAKNQIGDGNGSLQYRKPQRQKAHSLSAYEKLKGETLCPAGNVGLPTPSPTLWHLTTLFLGL